MADPAPPKNKGKQPQVESDEEEQAAGGAVGSTEATTAPDEDDGAAATTAGGAAAGSSSKKKSKRKKLKEALTGKGGSGGSGDGGPVGPNSDMKKAIESLTPAQLNELLKLNPALAEELGERGGGEGGASGSGGGGNPAALAEALKNMKMQDIMTGLAASGKNAKDMASYKFWQTQPVMKFGDEGSGQANVVEGPLKPNQKIEDVPADAPPLIEGFEWVTVDLTDDDEVKEVFELLYGHYVEDDAAMFRFNYSLAVLRWALLAPGWKKQWHIGVRASASRKLVAFIAAIPSALRVRERTLDASEVNFICIHKKLRGKRLAPVLIKEITRLINREGIWQAIYTAGVVLPKPVSTARYFHRALNWQKLYEVGFSPLPPGSKPQYQVRKFALPEQTNIKGLREMADRDVPAVHKLLGKYLDRFELAPVYTEEEIKHWMLYPKEGGEQVIWSYVVEDADKNITDFFSFYCLESSVINNARHQNVRAAYLFYYATDVALSSPVDRSALKARLNDLVHDALILAKRYKFDVFNALSLMDNALFLENQKFGPGDGQLHYYLFNYRANPIAGGVDKRNNLDEDSLSGVAFVML